MGVLDLTIWLLLAAAWTWPAALAQHHEIVGRHYDSMGTTWVMHSAPRFSHQFKDAMSAWPTVADYRRMDSFVLVFLSILLSSFSAAKLHGLFQIIGVATSAWAAQGLARAMGARRPWDMIGGLCFAFSGLAAHALIEGHMYHIMCPWLPLFVWAWYRAMCENQKWHYGTIAGVLFCLSLLTSAYLGVSAALIAAGLFLATVIRKRTVPWLQTLAASAIALPVILAILHLYGGDGDGLSRDMTVSTALQASAHCLSVLGATPELDRVQHSLALELSPLLLALVIVAPVVLGKRSPYRVLMWIAVSGLLLSIGPGFSVSDDQALFRTPLSLLANTPLKVVLRFPIRFAWICNLCGGILAAAVVTQLSLSGRRTAWLLLLLALLLPFAATRLPARQRTLTWSTPDVYATCAAPILDLFPVQAWPPNFDEMWFHHLACAYQTDHGLTIAANGMHTTPEGQPQVRLGQWTTRQLLAGHSDEAAAMLSALGFKTIVFHSDLFLQQDRERLNAALLEFGSTQIESTNSSVRVIAQAIPQLSPALPEQERIERYEKLIDALDATPGGEPLVETLHTTLTWPHTSGNHIAALVGMAVYTLTAIGWFLKPRISKLLHERHSAAHS
ncbi:MAG: hypothetical protein HN849_31165 [Victivallales bacterium]|nr:hypothetical protein [Victivallales bacterium]